MDKLMNSYPVYSADQVLTNKSLNNSVGYLDTQSRFTRSGMIGHGVVCGLNYFVDNNSAIHINAGYGSSIEGLLLQQLGVDAGQSTTYAFAKPYKLPPDVVSNEQLINPDAGLPTRGRKGGDVIIADPFLKVLQNSYELVPVGDEKIAQATLSVKDLVAKNLVLYLYLEIVDIKSENCSPEDCDEKGKLRRLRVVPLLAESGYFEPAQNYTGNKIEILNLNRMMDFENQYSSNELYKKFAQINTLNYNQIIYKLKEIKSFFENDNYIANNIENYLLDNFQTNNSKYVLDPNEHAQYAYDFLIDLGLALNEYAQHINCRPITTCSFSSNRYGRTLVLGKVLEINTYTDPYRYRFVEAPSVQEDNQYNMLAYKMYKRVWVLIQAYMGWIQNGRYANRGIIVSPSKSSPSLLGSRALPFYYNVNGDERNSFSIDYLLEQWSAHTCSNRSMYDIYGYNLLPIDKPSGNYDYNEMVLGNGINEYNFFRIEGHMGLDVNEAEKKVNDLINTRNLPFRTFRLNIKRNRPDVENPTRGFTGKITTASAKLRKASGVNIEAARIALPADQIPQIAFDNFNLYAQDFLGIGLNGATNLGGATTPANYTVDMFRLNTESVQTNPRINTLDYGAIVGTSRTVRLQVIGTTVGGESNKVFAGETYSITITLGFDYTYYARADVNPILVNPTPTTPPAPAPIAGKLATDAKLIAPDIIDTGGTGGGSSNLINPIVIPRFNRPVTVTVTATDGDTVESIAASLVSELLQLSNNVGQFNTVASATSSFDVITLTVRNSNYASYGYNVTAKATPVASGLTHYLNVEYIGGGTLLSPVEITICYKSPNKEIDTSTKVRMLTGESLVTFPPTLRAFLQGPAEYYELCGVVPLVIDNGGDDPPLDTEYNIWPFDAKGNLLFNIFKGAEHLAGVYRGGTFIFLTETIQGREETIERVVGDIALPWDLEYVKLSRAVALKFNRKYWKWGNQWDSFPTLGTK
jgi:hypothetical protein